ncbi:MAG: Ig-like domain-containing protein [Bacteroidia bacterium]|nr:Ig-like domain-containing protein [Bacteroidia bacterium]
MKRFLRIPHSWTAFILAVGLAAACASEGSLTGGDKDVDGPVVEGTYPETGTLNNLDREIVFTFDEFLKQGSYADEVFISPVQETKPEIVTGLKKIKIKLKDDLRPNTTYVITLGTGVKDDQEGNKMAKPYTLAFSTGATLDSMEISGKVIDPKTGAGEENFTMLLYPADEISGDSIWNRRPVYSSLTDEEGKFKLRYLSRQSYRIYAVKDGDRNFKYNSVSEKIAIASGSLIEFPDSADGAEVTLQSTIPDNVAPFPRSAKWINDKTVVVDFKEDIPLTFKGDSLQIYTTDTLGSDPQLVSGFNKLIKDKTKIFLQTSRAKEEYVLIQFKNLVDSLGNKRDTFIQINPNKISKDYEKQIILQPDLDEITLKYKFNFTYPLRSYLNGLQYEIRDTVSKKSLTSTYKNDNFVMEIALEEYPKKKTVLEVTFQKGIQFRSGNSSDTTVTFFLNTKDLENLGGLSGKVNDEELPGNWILFLQNEKGKTVRRAGENFAFQGLDPGKYTFWMFDDADSNGVYTPGSLHPYRLPEKVFIDSNPVEVRANWQVEDHKVVVQKTFKPSKSASGGGKKGSTAGKRSSAGKN